MKIASPKVLLPACVIAFFALIAVFSAPVSAHEHVHVGDYELVVGWRDEPAVIGDVNGLSLSIEHDLGGNLTEMVTGAEGTLTATISTGGISAPKALEPQFGRPGSYTFDVILTREGGYSIRLAGAVNGTAVNVSVDMDDPVARSDLEFPVSDPTPSDLDASQRATATAQQAAIENLHSQNAALQAQASTALTVGAIGLLAGVAGAAVGALAMKRGRTPP